MSDYNLIEKSIKKFKDLKSNFENLLQNLSLEIIPTQTTFCLIKLPKNITGKSMKEKLAKQNIFIKDCSIYPDLGKQYIYLGVPQKQYQKFCVVKMKVALEELC
jgi:histidinol-phosphate/aromatic aminotransferase/cobyric acid decarboxylase-like protein